MRDASREHHHGRLREAVQDWDEAARHAERRVDRDEAEYREARGLLRLGDEQRALVLLDTIAARRPLSRRTVRARFDAALVRRSLGERAEAREALLWIVRERPGDGPAARSLGLLLEDLAHEPDADRLAFLRELYEHVGTSDLGDDILAAEAEILRDRGDRPAAIAALERLVREHPYPFGQLWDDALWRLADLAEEAEDYAGAIEYLRRMLEPEEGTIIPGSQTLPLFPRARLRIARIYRDHLDDPSRAAEDFLGTYEQFPTSRLRDDALYELGVMWIETGRRADGCSMLERVVSEFEVGHARRLAARRLESDCRGRPE